MKNIKILFLTFVLFVSQANALTKEQYNKLNTPIVKVVGDEYHIEEYNAINFTKDVLFDGQSTKRVIVKTKATMKKDAINKEQFIAIGSTVSDQIIQAIFMSPQYFPNIKSIELLTEKPDKINLTIKMVFKKDGIDTIIKNDKREDKRFVPYDQMFHQRLQ